MAWDNKYSQMGYLGSPDLRALKVQDVMDHPDRHMPTTGSEKGKPAEAPEMAPTTKTGDK